MKRHHSILFLIALLIGSLALYSKQHKPKRRSYSSMPFAAQPNLPKPKSSFSAEGGDDAISRAGFELNRLRDPLTGKIPPRMRERELNFVQQLNGLSKNRRARLNVESWNARGPVNVGGRTRAIAVDLDFDGAANQRILAGGVSGGVFISDNNGASWRLATSLAQHASVTSLAQDPNNHSIWYHGTGEFFESVQGANFLGQGIFKSTDHGETWQQLPGTVLDSKPNRFDNPFDDVWNLAIVPQTGSILAAALGAVLRSTDGGDNWNSVLTGVDAQGFISLMTDVALAADGTVYAALSRNGNGLQAGEFGVFRSDNDGQSFANISPSDLVPDPYRMVLGTAPSDAGTLYLLVQATAAGETAGEHQLYRYNAGTNSWTNLSANIPNPPGPVGTFKSQGGYDLLVKVKPDNPNVFWIGGTNLHRSTNGGASFERVGGYVDPQTIALYANHHPDQHGLAFYPNNPNAAISTHDGGLSQSTNILESPQTWTRINNGYTTTQFYAVAVDPRPGNEELIMGGTQDNGTWLVQSTDSQEPWIELFGGDGAFAAFAPGGFPSYVSSQLGNVQRISLQNNQLFFSVIGPAGAENFLFVAPFLLDPNDARVMYLAAGNTVWRNSNLDDIPIGNGNPTPINWTALSNSAVANTAVTTLSVSTAPPNRLYFGANNNQMTVLRRVDNAQNNPSGSTITPPGIVAGSNTSSIGINPANGDELLVTYSNFNVTSLWYSADGGLTWADVEGNLAGEDGPSMRWAAISPDGRYFIATSTGVFSANSLNGANTTWTQEGSDVIGNVVVDMLVLRPEDGFLVAGTHGRGVYSANIGQGGGGTAVANSDVASLEITADPGQSASKSFTLSNAGNGTLNYSVSASADFQGNAAAGGGRYIATLVNNGKVGAKPWLRSQVAAAARGADATRSARNGKHASDLLSTAQQEDVIILDDGDNTADDFIGFNDGVNDFFWLNKVDIDFDFRIKGFRFFMRTESAFSNPVFVSVRDVDGRSLVEGNIDFATAPNGDWFQVNLNTPITFPAGSRFEVLVGASRTIGFPAGADIDGRVRRRSFFFDPNANDFVRLETISGFENGAFIIRPFGDILQNQNQPPNAQASVSPETAQLGQSITFDATGSNDPDGQITAFRWDFGDGATSTNTVATHAYSTAGTFTYSLTVTDDLGATDVVSGQVQILSGPMRLEVQPSSGVLAPGSSQLITVTLNAQDLPDGVFAGDVRVTGNGGTFSIPLTLTVGAVTSVETPNIVPETFALHQNYPNPFNPTTVISYSLPETQPVRIAIFNTIGQRVRLLVDQTEPAGEHAVTWDATNDQGLAVPSGLYFYRIQTRNFGETRKMTLLQ